MDQNLNSSPEVKQDRKKTIRRLLNVLLYGSATWVAVALVGYGLAVKQHEGQPRNAEGQVFRSTVVERSGIGRGYFGDVCFVLRKGPRFCIPQNFWHHGATGPGNIFDHLAVGTDVFMKTVGQYPIEVIIYPEDENRKKVLVDFGLGSTEAMKELNSVSWGPGYVILGLLLVPGIWLLRRFGIPRLRRQLIDMRRIS